MISTRSLYFCTLRRSTIMLSNQLCKNKIYPDWEDWGFIARRTHRWNNAQVIGPDRILHGPRFIKSYGKVINPSLKKKVWTSFRDIDLFQVFPLSTVSSLASFHQKHSPFINLFAASLHLVRRKTFQVNFQKRKKSGLLDFARKGRFFEILMTFYDFQKLIPRVVVCAPQFSQSNIRCMKL